MQKSKVELESAYRLVNPGGVVLISVGDQERDNLFAVTWNTPVRKDPPLLAIVSGKGHHSYDFIARTGEFGVNVPDAGLVDAVLRCGSVSGRTGVDKFERFGLARQQATKIKAPLVEQAVANLECRVTQVVDLGTSALLIAQVVEAVAADAHFTGGHWKFDDGLELLHHLSGDRFCLSDRVVTGKRT
ncbi:MAG: flavin reductase family protein [Deltaproteobacteria bacterium]|nr:flavin reductase family protein [Deltaproteobacteria bacterium]